MKGVVICEEVWDSLDQAQESFGEVGVGTWGPNSGKWVLGSSRLRGSGWACACGWVLPFATKTIPMQKIPNYIYQVPLPDSVLWTSLSADSLLFCLVLFMPNYSLGDALISEAENLTRHTQLWGMVPETGGGGNLCWMRQNLMALWGLLSGKTATHKHNSQQSQENSGTVPG